MKIAIGRPFHGAPNRLNERAVHQFMMLEKRASIIELGGPNLNIVRQAIAEKAVELGFDLILWVDGDMVFPIEAPSYYLRQAEALGAMVGALYIEKKMGGEIQANVMPRDGDVQCFLPDSPLIEAEEIGFGLVAMPVSFFTRVADYHALPWQSYLQDSVKLRPFFTPSTTAEIATSDDYVFCRLARAAGLKIFADTRFCVEHRGEYGYTLHDVGADPDRKKKIVNLKF